MEFKEVVRRRHAVRHFENEPVPHEVLERIAAEAQRAPSGGFSQGQRLVIVTEAAARKRIADLLGEDESVAEGWDPWVAECAALFIPCVSEQIYHRRYQESDKVDETGAEIEWAIPYWYVDVGATMMLVMLAAVDEGLGAGIVGVGSEDIVKLRRELAIPEEQIPIAVISIGRPLPSSMQGSSKRGWIPFEEFAHWERW